MKCSGPELLLPSALELYRLGLSVIPTLCGKKIGAVKWKPFQRQRADETTLRRWFGDLDNGNLGIGVVLGEVSGGVLVRDFDRRAAYTAWKRERPRLARTLPTVETRRGYHVYCRVESYKPAGAATFCRNCGDGELRGDGHIVVVPPSIHASTGLPYRWLVKPTNPIPYIALADAGFQTAAGDVTHEMSCVTSAGLPAPLSEALPDVIERTLPRKPGERHRQVFEFARYLRGFPELAERSAAELEQYVRQWHAAALPVIRTKDFATTLGDFADGWTRVLYSAGVGTLGAALGRAIALPPPAEAQQFKLPQIRLLVGLCRELQRQHGDAPFFLSCRDAAKVIGLKGTEPHVVAWRWLAKLCHVGILKKMATGTLRDRKANEYCYLGSIASASPLT